MQAPHALEARMKFALFAHVERYDQDASWADLFEELCQLVELAEDGGFETAWIGEHYGMQYTASPNPLTTLAYLARRTTRIRLGTGTIIAPFWQPVRLASEAALVDVLSAGRLDLGIARGAYQFEFDRLLDGMPAFEGGTHLREMIPALQGIWQGDFAYEGEVYRFPATASVPRPLQQPGPPIWIAAREQGSHDFAVEHGCNVMVTPLAKDDAEVEVLAERFANAVAANPHVPRPQLHLLRHAYVVESEAEAHEAALAVRSFYAHFEHWIRNDGTAVEGYVTPLDEAAMAEKPQYAPDVVRANQVIGTPAEVIARLRAYEALGVDQFGIWLDNTTSFEAKRRMLRLFIDEVVPAFTPALR
jgi:alkanesulfonate monooxygenase SsuD/methylene tetrahydromethanopterin reductase-like flavin-dependent oxidoreductase (luciferase family)